jgi:hypothetical protein
MKTEQKRDLLLLDAYDVLLFRAQKTIREIKINDKKE